MADFIFVLGGKNNGNEQLISYLKHKGISNISDYLIESDSDSESFAMIYINLLEAMTNRDLEFLVMPDVNIERLKSKILEKRGEDQLDKLFTFNHYLQKIDKTESQLVNDQQNQFV